MSNKSFCERFAEGVKSNFESWREELHHDFNFTFFITLVTLFIIGVGVFVVVSIIVFIPLKVWLYLGISLFILYEFFSWVASTYKKDEGNE